MDSVGRAGGLAVLWRKGDVFDLLGFFQHHIDMIVDEVEADCVLWAAREEQQKGRVAIAAVVEVSFESPLVLYGGF